MSVHIAAYRRKACASKWSIKSGPSGLFNSSCLLFRCPKNGAEHWPTKWGRNMTGRSRGLQNCGPTSRTRVLHTQSAPCVQWVAETLEPFVRFPCIGIDKAISKFHLEGSPSRMHFSHVDAAPKRALVAAPFEHKPIHSQRHSPQLGRKPTANGLCLGRHVARRQARGVDSHVDKLPRCHVTRN